MNDAVRNNATTTDIKDQGNYAQQRASTHNYAYDEVGNLIKDKSEEIAEISWTVTGKVSDVIRTEESNKPKLHFDYDAMGQRIVKTMTNKNVTMGDKFVTTYYVRDPQGNVLAVYEKKEDAAGAGQFQLKERHLYGMNRLGMVSQNVTLAQFDNSNVTNGTDPTTPQAGDTHYELTNHLGNVMAVISDTTSATAEPTVVSLSDYYPFGMTEPGRSWNSGDYRFGYTGHEKENDLAEGVYTTEYRLLDTRLGRWLGVDKLAGDYAWMSPYNYCKGNPMVMVDPDGKAGYYFLLDNGTYEGYGDATIYTYNHKDENAYPGENKGVLYSLGDDGKMNIIKEFEFVDPEHDISRLRTRDEKIESTTSRMESIRGRRKSGLEANEKDESITQVVVYTKEQINAALFNSGVDMIENQYSYGKYLYANNESRNKKMDYYVSANFKLTYELSFSGATFDFYDPVPTVSIFNVGISSGCLYLSETDGGCYAHNDHNFGNFLWGAGMNCLGIPESIAKTGGHWDCLLNEIQLDSKDDQRSIGLGYEWNYSRPESIKQPKSDQK